jgi:hypothetical protein
VTGPDLPNSHEPFNAAHLTRWPMGAAAAELRDGELVWAGDFDDRDAVVARRTFPGSRVRLQMGLGLIVGPLPADEPESREWTDEEGTRWHSLGGMLLRSGADEEHWTVKPWTAEERQRNHEHLAALRAEQWAAVVAGYIARPDDVQAAWRYLLEHPIFWSWVLPAHFEDADASEIDEAAWARIEARSWLDDSDGLADMHVELSSSDGATTVAFEHGPVLWPLDVPPGHRAGLRVGGTRSHDPGLDVAEPTWEQAIVALAAKVRRAYGDDRSRVAEAPPASDGD